jgi:hypothetical protein
MVNENTLIGASNAGAVLGVGHGQVAALAR